MHAIQHMNPPTTLKQVRAFLGLLGYYRKFIKGFAKIAKLLTLLTRQQAKFDWTLEHQEAFITLKEAIVQAPILHYPNPNKTYINTQMLLTMPVEHSSPKNTMEPSSQ